MSSYRPDTRRLFAAQGLRAFAYGFAAVLLGTSLEERDVPAWQVGVVLGATVAGTALMSMLVARYADRVGRRRWYAGLYVLLGVVGVVFAFAGSVWLLALAALTGVLSTEVIESGPFTSLEQPMLASDLRDRAQVHGFGVYNAIAAAAGSLGALAAAVPDLVDTAVLARWFLVLVPVAVIGWALACRLSGDVEPIAATSSPGHLSRSRSTVSRLASLFALDSFAGGFTVSAFVAYWLRARFDASPAVIAVTFFAIGLLQTVSFLAAPGWPTGSGCCARWCSPTCRPTCCSPRGVRPEPGHGDRAVVGPHGVVADGRPDPAGLRDGAGRPGRAHPRRRVHQHGPLRQPSGRPATGCAGPDGRVGLAVRDQRRLEVGVRPHLVALVPPRPAPRTGAGAGVIVCLRTVDVPADVRERYLAWIAEGRPVRQAHGILAELVCEPSSGQGETVVITVWPDHETFDAWIATPERDALTASAVHQAVDYRPITRYDVIGGYLNLPGLHEADPTPEEDP